MQCSSIPLTRPYQNLPNFPNFSYSQFEDPFVEMDTASTVHMVALPYPGRGHINPMMNLCKLLASTDESLLITFVATEEWLGLIGSGPTPPNIRLRSIPNVIPSELVRATNLTGFVEAVFTKMEEPFERLLEQLKPKVSCIVADTYMPWAVSLGMRWNVAVASLWPMAPSMFSILYHFDLVNSNFHFPICDVSGDRGEERVHYIPGISSIRLVDLPYINVEKGEPVFNRILEAISLVPKSHCLLFTSFYELENNVIDCLRAKLQLPIYHVGPTIPYMTLQDLLPKATDHSNMDYFVWLDSQQKSSVLYISLGSFLSVSGPQMDEIAIGLRTSGVCFLWVARRDAMRLQEVSGSMGLVVPWCDQLRVLCHSSVGGFLTHCGWNSTMESVYAGVPMLTFPIIWDQIPNAKLIVEDWKIGLWLKQETGDENVVRGQEIAQMVKWLMDLDGDENQQLRRRVGEVKEACRRAIEKGGSSQTNLGAFVKEIVQAHKN